MPELQFLKTLFFLEICKKWQSWVNIRFFSHLKSFSVSIIKKITFIVSVKLN